MIGEIRDQETASIACQAANTGHMVFSTVHSNDAVTALFRLLDLGVEPFMIASALTGRAGPAAGPPPLRGLQGAVQAQARVPQEGQPARSTRSTSSTAGPRTPSRSASSAAGPATSAAPASTSSWSSPSRMRDMIRENPSINKIKAEARKNGMIYLQEDGLRQVIQGRTSIEELLRVVK